MNNKITFPRLSSLLADKAGRSKRFSEDFLREFFALISEQLEAGDVVKVKGLGTFRLSRVEPRKSVDVTTGEPMEISGHSKVVFTPAKELAEAVNAPFEAFSAIEIDDNVDIDKLVDSDDDINTDDGQTLDRQASADDGKSSGPTTVEMPEETEESVLPIEKVYPGEKNEVKIEEGESVSLSEEKETDISEDNKAGGSEENEADTSKAEETDEAQAGNDVEESSGSEVEVVENPDTIVIERPIPSSYCDGDDESADEFVIINEGSSYDSKFQSSWNYASADSYEIGRDSNKWLRITFICLACAILGVIVTFAIWAYLTKPEFKDKSDNDQAIIAGYPESYGQINSDLATADAEESKIVVDEDEIFENPSDEVGSDNANVAETVPTAPSDAVVYDTIGTSRFLTTMAKAHYGNNKLWPYIYEENKDKIGHPDKIRPGTPIRIPKLSKFGIDPNNPADITKANRLASEIYERYGKKI